MSELALLKKDVVDVVTEKIRTFQENKELHLPSDYSVENAMKSAWLTLQETTDKDGKLALEVCTKDSIANALLDMAVQGLNPAKKQCYFVPYGKKLVLMRSYHGSKAVVKRVAKAQDVYAQVVYKGDDFVYSIENGRKKIIKHEQKIENVVSGNILAAYCVITFPDGRPDYVDIMTIDQIKKAWSQGKTYKEDGNSTHQKFDEEMAKKTVINRACKAYINASSDDSLLLYHFNRTEEAIAEAEVDEEIAENANMETIDIHGEVQSDEPEQATDTEGPGF